MVQSPNSWLPRGPFEIQPPGTEFLDAETGSQKSAQKCAKIPRDEKARMAGDNPGQNGLFRDAAEIRGLEGVDGGRDRDRTCDPLDVNEVLSR